MPSRNLSGGKYTATHSSVIEAAYAPTRAAAALSCVSKISLGMITPLGNGRPAIKFLDEGPGCLLAKVRGPRSLQEIRIYTSDKDKVSEVMLAA